MNVQSIILMNDLHFIPDEIQSDEELKSWLEEQAARFEYHSELAFQDEEAMRQDELLTWSWS